MKVSQLNKRLIVSLDALYQKYTYISSKIIENNTTINANSDKNKIDTVPTNVPGNTNASVSNVNDSIIPESVELKLDQLEQKNNINILSCNGDFINDLTYNDNKELKSKVFDKVKTVYPSLSDSDIETVVPLNKNIKRIKIFCRCPDTK